MKAKLLLSASAVFFFLFLISSCTKDAPAPSDTKTVYLDLPDNPYNYSTFNSGGVLLQNSMFNSDVATVGRVLFYDTQLSLNNSISCGSCHKQSNAFADNVSLSRGYQNHLTGRNSSTIQNLSTGFTFNASFGSHLFWDGRAILLNTMVFTPMMNHIEMGMSDIPSIVEKINSIPYYKELFEKAFGEVPITAELVGQALGQFVSCISSRNTKFDQVQQGNAEFSALEKEGQSLFFNKYDCNSCHQQQFTNGYEIGGGFVNIGLETEYSDNGFQNVSGNPADNGKFKIPDLRNVALSAPYMHDGRFATLNDVLNHYSEGIVDHPSLDPRLRDQNGAPRKMNITEHEKTAIIAFLNTMTDFSSLTDPRFSSPFKVR